VTRHLLFVGVALALGIGALPAPTGHCASSQAALRAPRCCCGPSADDACAMACAQETGSQRYDLRAATTEPISKTFLNTIAYRDLTASVLMLASAGSSTTTSPASVPRRYLLSHTLRL